MDKINVSNEVKAKVFAQYLGCECKATVSDLMRGSLVSVKNIDLKPEVEIVNNKANTCFNENIERCTLILRPISGITNIEALKVLGNAGIEVWPKECQPKEYALVCLEQGMGAKFHPLVALEVFQELQQLGFDIRQYLLGGKTLFEAGLAIYE